MTQEINLDLASEMWSETHAALEVYRIERSTDVLVSMRPGGRSAPRGFDAWCDTLEIDSEVRAGFFERASRERLKAIEALNALVDDFGRGVSTDSPDIDSLSTTIQLAFQWIVILRTTP